MPDAKDTHNAPEIMTIKELAEYLRVHPSTLYKLLRRGTLPGFRIGSDWRFHREVIDRWCSERNLHADYAAMSFNRKRAKTR
jgi:excisionase family DNA binding protein